MQSEQSKFNIIWSGAIITIFIFLLLQLVNLRGDPQISSIYLDVYSWMMMFNIIVATISLAFIFFREPITAHFSPPASSDEYRIIPWTWLKFVLIIIFAISILFSVTTFKVQFAPIPKPLNVGYTISPISEMYLSSVIPGVAEDFAFFWALPQLIFNLLWLLFLITLRIDVRASKGSWFGIMLIAIFISSIGYGIIVPGFASAHSQVYQDYTPAYLSAFFFGFTQSVLYAVTGLFFPLPHILHNALFILGFAIALSIGGVATTLIPFLKIKWRYRNVK
jgi:hypothetical protein